MKQYIFCSVLLFCPLFNFSSEQLPDKLVVVHHRLGDVVRDQQRAVNNQGAPKNNRCCLPTVGHILTVGALVALFMAWPSDEEIAHRLAKNVDCMHPLVMNNGEQGIYDVICNNPPSDGNGCKPYFGNNINLRPCNLTIAQQRVIFAIRE